MGTFTYVQDNSFWIWFIYFWVISTAFVGSVTVTFVQMYFAKEATGKATKIKAAKEVTVVKS